MTTFSDIIMRWPSAEEYARDVQVLGGTARAWKNRNRIPASHWLATVNAAQARGFDDVTLERLAEAAKAPAG